MEAMFPERNTRFGPLAEDHPIWRAKNQLDPRAMLSGASSMVPGTSVIYSPKDLSCFWNQRIAIPPIAPSSRPSRSAENVVEYVHERQIIRPLAMNRKSARGRAHCHLV